jgi:hypothetical protein
LLEAQRAKERAGSAAAQRGGLRGLIGRSPGELPNARPRLLNGVFVAKLSRDCHAAETLMGDWWVPASTAGQSVRKTAVQKD